MSFKLRSTALSFELIARNSRVFAFNSSTFFRCSSGALVLIARATQYRM